MLITVLSPNRQIQYLQHYKDHMKLHDNPLQHFCYHMECNQRFLTPQELKDHINAHQPFRPQCPFTDCEKLFSSFQGLYDHEWRHYIPAPQRDELEFGLNRQKKQNAEAPWKQRVKVEEIWLQSKKVQKENPTLDHVTASYLKDFNRNSEIQAHPCEENVPEANVLDRSQDLNLSKADNCSEPINDSKAAINGYETESSNQVSAEQISSSGSSAAAGTPRKICRKKVPVERDPLNVRDLEDLSTLSEGVQQKLGEPHITEHKTFKPEDPSYATFVKAPFIRPPPSTYLDESVLSMRKRRSTDEVTPKKNVYWNSKKKEEPVLEKQQQQQDDEAPDQKIRSRCDKCLSSFSSLEELQKHQALNTCSALFGFDSDDESK